MKKLLLSLITVLAFAGVAMAANTNSNDLFRGKEVSLRVATGYTLDANPTSIKGAFGHRYDLNFNAGAAYFFTKNFGIEGNVPFYQNKGVSVSQVEVGLLARLPLGHFAPYAGLGAIYAWNDSDKFTYNVKGGLEYRLNKHLGVFGEADYRNKDFVWKKAQTSINAGVRFAF